LGPFKHRKRDIQKQEKEIQITGKRKWREEIGETGH
jgi:hypothetical protein